MKHAFLAVMLLAAATAGVVQAADTNPPPEAPKAAPAGAPKIQFDKTVYDFGTTSQVTSVTGTFTFHNAGDAELKLQKPAPSCGCTVAKVIPESMTLKPGEKGELMFTVNLGAAKGSLEKHINVPSNDPQSPNINLGIKVTVQQVFDVNPTQVMIGDVHLGEKTNVTVQVHRNDGKKLSITKTEVAGDFAKARVEAGENEQSAKVLIDVAGQGAPRRFTDQVKLFVDGADQPSVTIFLTGRLAGDVNVTPEALYWGVQDPEKWPGSYPEGMTTRKISITAGQNVKALELTNLTSSLKEVTLELVAGEKGKSYTLVAKLAESPKESTRGTISFDTNLPTQPKVVLPVTVNVVKR
jgi:opacity protein-like surface antigen